jgi:hypothetical protein
MSGKSLNDIWSQMQAQRAAEQQIRMAQERSLNEQRQRQRQDHLQRMRMFESLNTINPSAAAAAGGSNLSQTTEYNELIQQSFLINWVDTTTDEWKIVVYNYDTGVLSDIINTGLLYDTGNEWYLYTDTNTVHNKGFTFVLQNYVTSKYKIFFIQPDGRLVDTKDLDTNEDFQYTENAIIYLGNLDGVSTCYHYDGTNVRTHSFPNVTINLIEVDDASNEDVTRDGTIIIEAPNNSNYYLARPNGDLVDVTDYLSVVGTGNIVMDYNMTFITKHNSDNSAFKIVSQEGVLVNEFDLTPYPITTSQVFAYGENSVFFKATDWPISGNELFLSYDGDSNQFVTLTFSSTTNQAIRYSYVEKSYYSPRPGSGNHLIVANYNEVALDSLGYIVENLNLWWLPKGATSFQNYDFGTNFGMTVSFIEGFGDFTGGNRIFSEGINPIVMYSAGIPNDILVGFMTSTGLATQSTGVQYASCSNIWGSYLGENSFAVFDLDSGDRLWQVYDDSSILAETTTTSNWSWGYSGETVNRKGTLCVIDSDDTTLSFIWTEQVGLQAGPTGLGQIYNENFFAIRDYESYSEQIITQYITGEESSQFVEGFHLLTLSGLSEKVIFPGIGLSPSYYYTVDRADVGKDILYFSLIEDQTSNRRTLVYKKSDLSLIYDYNPGNNTFNDNVYDNRVYIVEDNLPSVNFILIGHMGVQTLEINATFYGYESNDADDND